MKIFGFLLIMTTFIDSQFAQAAERLITCNGEALETTEDDYQSFRFNIRNDSKGHIKASIYYSISNSSKTWKNLQIVETSDSLTIFDNTNDPFKLIISKKKNHTTIDGFTGASADFTTKFTEGGYNPRFIVINKANMACEISEKFKP